MEVKLSIHLISAIILVWCHSRTPVFSNPIPYDQTLAPLLMPSIPMSAPMLMNSRYDPYAMSAMQTPAQYMLSPPFGLMPPFENNRRSNSRKERDRAGPESDEQKDLGDLPVSFLEPEAPQTISERLSDSFSAIGEGFKNHFKSLSENFSDTLDDIKDAWRPSERRG